MDVHWVDKVEVARRQIREAVRLFFEARDLVVIHTVIASAHLLRSRLPLDTHLGQISG